MHTEVGMEHTPCNKSHNYINARGEVIPPHQVDYAYDLNDYVSQIRKIESDWKTIYYKVWAMSVILKWNHWNQYFRLLDLGKCKFHTQKALFLKGKIKGLYPWCNTKAMKFPTFNQQNNSGWFQREHQFEITDKVKSILERFEKQKALIFGLKSYINHNKINFSKSDSPIPAKRTSSENSHYSASSKSDISSEGDFFQPSIPNLWNLISKSHPKRFKRYSKSWIGKLFVKIDNLRNSDSKCMDELGEKLQKMRLK